MPITNALRQKYTLELVRKNWRAYGKYEYHYYLTMCIYFLNKPFGFINYKKKAKKCLKAIKEQN